MVERINTPQDGGARRALGSRGSVISAAMELLDEGNISPTATEIAVRARLGRRTHQRAVPAADGGQWRHLFDEPFRQRLGYTAMESLLAAPAFGSRR